MTVFVCDPGLTHFSGHHARWDEEFARLFSGLGHDVHILSHGNFRETELAGVPVHQHFTKTRWHEDNRTNLLRNWDLFFDTNRTIFSEMQQLSKKNKRRKFPATRSGDLVVFPTILQFQLSGVIDWFSSLEKKARPTVLCYLMGPSGCMKNGQGDGFLVDSFDTARFYRVAFRAAAQAAEKGKQSLHFFACGEMQAQQYSFLRSQKVDSYPLLNSAIQPDQTLRTKETKTVLLYVGDPRDQKGARLLPSIISEICPLHSDWRFIVQLGVSGVKSNGLEKLRMALAQLEDRFENFELIFERLPNERYQELFNESEIVVTPYNADYYRNHSSGIVWEGLATANTLVVPDNSWLSLETKRLNAAYVKFDKFTTKSVVEAISIAIKTPPKLRTEKIDVAIAFKAQNHPRLLKGQIANVWPDLLKNESL